MRPIIQTLPAYDPKVIDAKIVLHANEVNRRLALKVNAATLATLNRYPDHQGDVLKQTLSSVYGFDPSTLLIGSGSSELLALMVKTFVDKDEVVLSFDPTFIMYAQYTLIHGGQYQTIPYSSSSLEDLYQAFLRLQPKLIFISNPNNPTGEYMSASSLLAFIRKVNCPVVIDEAYIEYVNEKDSLAYVVSEYPNLYVTRTFSKAYALAGARLGYLITQKKNLENLKRAKTPYSVSHVSLALGIEALKQKKKMQAIIQEIIITREKVYLAMKALGMNVQPSSANFLYVHEPTKDLYGLLLQRSILIRKYDQGYYRISIGTPKEMTKVIQTLKEIYHD